MVLLVLGVLGAPDAGQVSDGMGELDMALRFEPTAAVARPCSQTASVETRDLVFEKVRPGDLDADQIRRLAAGAREMVQFKWNADTGELTYDTSAPTGVFSDLAWSSQVSLPVHPACESR